ncbi:MAG: hypothetical protein ACRCUS_07045 [Anaerovoracaceae bacterium]
MEKNKDKDILLGDMSKIFKYRKQYFINVVLVFLLVGMIIGIIITKEQINQILNIVGIVGIVGGIVGIVGIVVKFRIKKILLGELLIIIGGLAWFVGAGMIILIMGVLVGKGLFRLGDGIALLIGIATILIIIGIVALIDYLDNDTTKKGALQDEGEDKVRNMLIPIITNTNRQIKRLKRNAIIDLTIGIISHIIALGILIYVIITQAGCDNDWIAFTIHFLPRFTFVVFIELFAYFFLNLYRKNLDDINYFQNELTNLTAKTTAIKMLHTMQKEKDVAELIKELFKTERNFKLAKGESTIDIEKAKIDRDWEKTIAAIVEAVIKNISKK